LQWRLIVAVEDEPPLCRLESAEAVAIDQDSFVTPAVLLAEFVVLLVPTLQWCDTFVARIGVDIDQEICVLVVRV
jgi:hypothetical protein